MKNIIANSLKICVGGLFIFSRSIEEVNYRQKCRCQTWGQRKKLLGGHNGFENCVFSSNALVPQFGPLLSFCVRGRWIHPCSASTVLCCWKNGVQSEGIFFSWFLRCDHRMFWSLFCIILYFYRFFYDMSSENLACYFIQMANPIN